VKVFPVSLRRKAANIKLLLLDVDGVLTDGRIIIDDRGVESKHFHVRDGHGIVLLKRSGIEVGFITGRSSPVVGQRAKELQVTLLFQGVQDKLRVYERIKKKRGLSDGQIAYVGDDIVDIPVLRRVGLAVMVSDGSAELKPIADYVTVARGGMGAVREVAELILMAHNKWSH